MRVLFITGNFPPLSGGLNGGALVALRLARSMCRSGIQCGIFNGETIQSFKGELRALIWNEMPTWSLSVGDRLHPEVLSRDGLMDMLKSVCDDFRPDVIHVFQYECWHGHLGVALLSLGVPVVFTALDFGVFCARSTLVNGIGDLCDGNPGLSKCGACLIAGRTPLIRLARRVGRLMPKMAMQWPLVRAITQDAISNRKRLHEALSNWPAFSVLTSYWIAPSEAMKRKLLEHGISALKISHIPYGFDAEESRPSKPDDGSIVFGYAGRPVYEKGFHLLTEAFAKTAAIHSEARLLLFVPKSEMSNHYTSDAFRHLLPFEDRVEWGKFDGSEEQTISSAHARIHCMVVPSIWRDNLPLTVVESLANGTPVIASAHSSASEPIKNEFNGLLFDYFEKTSLALQMGRFCSDEALRKRLLSNTTYERTYRDEVTGIQAVYAKCIEVEQR